MDELDILKFPKSITELLFIEAIHDFTSEKLKKNMCYIHVDEDLTSTGKNVTIDADHARKRYNYLYQ